MDISRIDERLLAHPGAMKSLHESWGWMVYWVGGKQFACEFVAAPDAKLPYAGRRLFSLKCDPDRIHELRAEYPDAVLPGYYSDGRTWISVDVDRVGLPDGPPEGLVLDLCDMGYRLVFSKLTKKAQREISEGAAGGFRETAG